MFVCPTGPRLGGGVGRLFARGTSDPIRVTEFREPFKVARYFSIDVASFYIGGGVVGRRLNGHISAINPLSQKQPIEGAKPENAAPPDGSSPGGVVAGAGENPPARGWGLGKGGAPVLGAMNGDG